MVLVTTFLSLTKIDGKMRCMLDRSGTYMNITEEYVVWLNRKQVAVYKTVEPAIEMCELYNRGELPYVPFDMYCKEKTPA